MQFFGGGFGKVVAIAICARLRDSLIGTTNSAFDVWADSACCPAENQRYIAGIGKVSQIHSRQVEGKPTPRRIAKATVRKSAVRAAIKHPFAHQKRPRKLVIRTIGFASVEAAITLANLAYNMKRWCWLDGRSAPA